MKKFTSTFLYTVSSILVLFLVVFSVSILEKTFGLHTLYRAGDIDMIFLILFFGILVFGFVTKKLNLFEGNHLPVIFDHICHSGILYIFSIILLIEYFKSKLYSLSGLYSALYTIILGIFFIGIIVNAITLFIIYRIRK